jgi:hypothetical protein
MTEDLKEDKARCIDAGIKLLRENASFREATPILYKDSFHLKEIDPIDFKVPHSEVAIFEKAAGRDIVAFFASRNMAFVAFSDDGGCGFAYGAINEMLTPALAKQVRAAYFPEQVKGD